MKHKEIHKTVDVIESEGVFLGILWGNSLYKSYTLFISLHQPSSLSVRLLQENISAPHHLLPTSTYSVDVIPKWPHVPLPVIPETAGVATRSGCAKKKNLAIEPQAERERHRPQRLITPSHDSTHQDSSSNKSISL